MKSPVILILSLLLFCVSCSDRHTSFPRPMAFPRFGIEHDSIGHRVEIDSVFFDINRQATLVPDSANPLWANVVYPPQYGATIHLSLSRPADMAEAVSNRMQRFSLNLQDTPATSEEFTSGPWKCYLLLSNRPTVTTPVQFFAANGDGRFLTGAAVLRNPGTSADSIAPLVSTLCEDVRLLLFSLK